MEYEKYLMTEEYRIDEGMTFNKAFTKLKGKLSSVSTPIEMRLATSMMVKFIKTFNDQYTDEVATEVNDLLDKAIKRIS